MKQYVTLNKAIVRRGRQAIDNNPDIDIKSLIPAGIDGYNQYYAVFASYKAIKQAQKDGVKPLAYLSKYAMWKKAERLYNNDYGALSDLIEVCVRLIRRKKVNLIHLNDIAVKPLALTTDTFKQALSKADYNGKQGIYEIATNGKTFLESTETDYMSGNYQGVIYGVFELEELITIADMLIDGEYQTAFTNIADNMYVWFNKYQFEKDINTVSRGKGITFKPSIGYAQIVYNPSKHSAFIKRFEGAEIPTLSQVDADSELLW